jgi:hypothetical protein
MDNGADLTNCGLLPTTERIRTATANLADSMAVKVLLSGIPLFARGYGAGRELARYVAWRLQQA